MKNPLSLVLDRALRQYGRNKKVRRTMLAILLIAGTISIAAVAFLLQVNLSTAGSLELFLVLFVALRFGFLQATLVSISAVLCLNFLFIPPVFSFTVADPQNWVSLFTFEATALLVSRLSSQVRLNAADLEEQRARAVKLYDLSRAVLLIDQLQPVGEQLARLIREIFEVDEVEIWVASESGPSQPGPAATEGNHGAYVVYLEGRDSDDMVECLSRRVLRLGESVVGGLILRGWKIDPLTADAVASLAAITFERMRVIRRESRVEAERDAERLRTVVLDGLAHGFKTPLTAIQTASSGLLAINQLNATQVELVSIIDEQATLLNQLTTRLLQTAALEAKEIRLRRSSASILELLLKVLQEQDEETRGRISLKTPRQLRDDQLDVPMIELALQQLVDNAAKYSWIGTPIEITVSQTASETSVSVQNITMAGSSIKPEEQTKIFERFYRGSGALHGPVGTGLGLSIVKKAAEGHGGRAWVECANDTTRFVFAIQHYQGAIQQQSQRERHG